MKTKTSILSLVMLLLIIPISIFAQVTESNKSIISEPFSKISAKGTFSLVIEQGDEQSISFDKENGVKYSVKDETLTINSSNGSVVVKVKTLNEISSSDAVVVKSQNTIVSPGLMVTLKDASIQNLSISADKTLVNVHDASKLTLNGKTTDLSVTTNDASVFKGAMLETKNAMISTNDASVAWVNVSEGISGKTNDVSVLHYFENVKNINVESNDFSKAKKFNEIKIEDEDNSTAFPLDSIGNIITDILVETDSSFKDNGSTFNNKWYEGFFSKKRYDGNWGGLMLGFNNFVTPAGKMEVPVGYEFLELDFTGSRTFALNLFEQNFSLIKNKLGVTTGLGFQWYNYRFAKNAQVFANQTMINGMLDTANITKYKKSKLAYTTLNIPLLLEFQTNPNHNLKSFHLNAGVIFGVKLGSHSKTIIDDGAKTEIEVKDDFNLNPIRVDATAGIGYGKLNLFASYALTPLFKEKEGPKLYPVTAGIYLMLW